MPFATGTLAYSDFIDADTIRVTFNGTMYECEKVSFKAAVNVYGGLDQKGSIDFSQYPFAISSANDDGNDLATENAGTYSLKIEAIGESVETTPCFEKAVKSVIGNNSPLTVKFAYASGAYYYFDKSFEQVQEAFFNGREVILEWGTLVAGTWRIEEYIALKSIDITDKFVEFSITTLQSPKEEGGNLYSEPSQ